MNNIEQYYHVYWESLDKERKEKLFQDWDAQKGEGFPIAIMALARLVISFCSEFPIGHANVGIYHGGTYLLKVSLSESCDSSSKSQLPAEFEGFPVIWANCRNEWIGGFRMGG
jgi:hypothetical protein